MEYEYSTHVDFGSSIELHNILLRCLPAQEAYQRVVSDNLYFSEGFWLREGHDGFGNRIISGGTDQSHSTLQYTSSGIVEQTTYCIPDAEPHRMFFLPSRLTLLPHEYHAPAPEGSFLDRCLCIMHYVHELIVYRPNTTTMLTTVADLLVCRQGVCQDYAHMMVALCRAAGMAARYVCGLMAGEGQTHAWVEVHDGQCWYAFDPTNDTAIASGYIKLAHGRDALDCPVNRGTYRRGTFTGRDEMTRISVIVKEIK